MALNALKAISLNDGSGSPSLRSPRPAEDGADYFRQLHALNILYMYYFFMFAKKIETNKPFNVLHVMSKTCPKPLSSTQSISVSKSTVEIIRSIQITVISIQSKNI